MLKPLPVVAGYDPYIARGISGIKRALASGFPIMVRLHPGPELLGSGEAREANRFDREGHAVLLVGYDDGSQAFDVIDPLRDTNECSALSYEQFGLRVVDGTLDYALILSPFVLGAERLGGTAFALRVAFFSPEMPVMDETEMVVRAVTVSVGARVYRAPEITMLSPSVLRVDLLDSDADDDRVLVSGVIVGKRPTPYERVIDQELTVAELKALAVRFSAVEA